MKKLISASLVLVGALVSAGVAMAHHSFAAEFDSKGDQLGSRIRPAARFAGSRLAPHHTGDWNADHGKGFLGKERHVTHERQHHHADSYGWPPGSNARCRLKRWS